MTANDPNIRVELRLTRVTTNGGDDYMQLRVGDAESGRVILDVDLTPEEFTDLLTGRQPGSVHGVAAWFTPPAERQHIGKSTALASLTYRTYSAPTDETQVAAWLESVRQFIGADAFDAPRRQNTGDTAVHFRVYLDGREQAREWRTNAQAALDSITPPWATQ